jgi:hypothetical protein
MNRKIIAFALLLVLLTACSSGAQPDPTPWPETVEWEAVAGILNSGHVVEVMQLHNLSVTLRMDDGSLIKTVEPLIDEIFREVAQCGQPCKGIILVTE